MINDNPANMPVDLFLIFSYEKVKSVISVIAISEQFKKFAVGMLFHLLENSKSQIPSYKFKRRLLFEFEFGSWNLVL